MKDKGIITDIQRYSINDGKGIRTVIFFKGCPLRCEWCSNPETQSITPQVLFSKMQCIGCMSCHKSCPIELDLPNNIDHERCTRCQSCVNVCPTGALELVGKEMTVDAVLHEAEKDRLFYMQGGGITLSGGEVLMQWEFAAAILKKAREVHHMQTAIETTGFANWDKLWEAAQFCDEILYDIKHMDDATHKRYTGISNEKILDNIKKLAKQVPDKIIIRVPLIEGVNSEKKHIEEIGKLANQLNIKEVHLLPYHKFGEPKYQKLGRSYTFEGKTPSNEIVETDKKVLEDMGIVVKIGG